MDQRGTSARKLYRSRRDKVIAGVCGGVAEYFNIDPVWVRIGWVLSIFLKGLGIVAYLLCWILIPEREAVGAKPGPKEEGEPGEGTAGGEGAGEGAGVKPAGSIWPLSGSPRMTLGIVLILLGCIFAVSAYVPFVDEPAFWALLLIVAGLVLIAKR